MKSLGTILDPVDRRLGDGVDRLVCMHHHRRLRRLGWAHALNGAHEDGREGYPARDGNRVRVLVDGEEALAAMVAAIAAPDPTSTSPAGSRRRISGPRASPGRRRCVSCSRRSPSGSRYGCCCGRDRPFRCSSPPGA